MNLLKLQSAKKSSNKVAIVKLWDVGAKKGCQRISFKRLVLVGMAEDDGKQGVVAKNGLKRFEMP